VFVQVVVRVLGIFAEAAPLLSATSHSTLNEAVPVYNCLFKTLEGFLGQRNNETAGREKAAIIDSCSPANRSVIKRALEAAHAKLCTHYRKTWANMYTIATILDPRCRTEYFQVNHWEESLMDAAKAAVQRVMRAYGATTPQPDKAHKGKFREEIFEGMKRRLVQEEDEFEKYLSAQADDDDTNVLEWWRLHAGSYPYLARVARDYLAIPATSVPAERVFSVEADLVTKKRGSLHDDTIQECACLCSWWKA
jgi:hAT family C-terminal dimerisation region